MKPWKKLSESIQKVGYKSVTTKTFEMPDGVRAEYTIWGHPSDVGAAVIALTKDNEVVIARQFRAGPEAIFEELPGGGVEPEEDHASAALRELQEETGYVANGEVIYLGSAYHDAYGTCISHYYLARDCEPRGAQILDEGEFVEIALIPIEKLVQNAKDGKMSDGIAVLMALDELLKIGGKHE